MQKLDRLAQYFSEKERKRLDSAREKTGSALPEMSPEEIIQSCRENDGYETPELNEKLYLHFRGFKRIQNLEPYTACKALWLDSNGLETLEGFSSLTELRCLYLGKNLLTKIEGLASLTQLSILDLSNNRLSHIDNLSCCPNLQTINLSRNSLSSAESISHLSVCNSIQNVDVTNNALAGNDILLVFSKMQSLTALSINGNPVTQSSGFRKHTIYSATKLGYLDRPIDQLERIAAIAFVEGGVEAEKAARDTWKENEKKKRTEEMATFRVWQEEQRQKRINDGPNRITMTEFTEEELQQRREEADRAATAERRMLDLGVDRIGKKYWQIESQLANSQDALAAAVEAVEREVQEENERTNAAYDDTTATVPMITPPLPPLDSDSDSLIPDMQSEENTIDNEENVSIAVPDVTPSVNVEGVTAVDEDIKVEGEVEEVEVEEVEVVVDLVNEAKQQAIRDERVAESLRIFFSQQNVSKQKQQEQQLKNAAIETVTVTANMPPPPAPSSSSSTTSVSNTWDRKDATPVMHHESQLRRPLYWSEYMDLLLARLVREHSFDFIAIANHIQVMVQSNKDKVKGSSVDEEDGTEDGVDVDLHNAADRLSADECRMRWAQLDADQWAVTNPKSSALDTVFRICVQPSMLGKGHGAQPSFDAMRSLAAGSMPLYLTPPTKFPSVQDIGDEEDDEIFSGKVTKSLESMSVGQIIA